MNEHLILSMAEPYVKDGSITYDQFENIYSMLSLKEMYDVTEILYKNGIDLIAEVEIDEYNFDNERDYFPVLYDISLFKDDNFNPDAPETLVVNRNIKQSNEILCTLIQQGNLQATQDLCVKNKGLVDKCVNACSKKYSHHLDFEDLEQVGFMGLIKAAQKFDIKLGYSFSTYAVWWIKQAISREIMDNGFAIRIPVHMMERINKLTVIENKFSDYIPEKRIKKIADEMGITEKAVRECMVLKTNILMYSYLNAPVGEEEDSEIVDFIPSEDVLSVEDIVTNRELRRSLDEALDTLKDRERQVIRMRFGLDDGEPRTLEYLGQKFGVTRERIRQIEAKALRKMRHPSKSRKLKQFL